jgi:anthranilate phosphoribosyltransferase
MGISHYIKDIGRGKDGARALGRAQATDLMAQVLDGAVSDLELGAFCLAMRIKGETPEEMAGFLDAATARLNAPVAAPGTRVVVLPSYNGARRLPLLTPLLALWLARAGLCVLVHGYTGEARRLGTGALLQHLAQEHPQWAIDLPASHAQAQAQTQARPQVLPMTLVPGCVHYLPLQALCPGLQRLLDVRAAVGLRNSGHSMVKLLNPSTAPSLLVSSYTHPEYAASMAATLQLVGTHALLLRGTEGEPVADPRRLPQIDRFQDGIRSLACEAQTGPLATLPDLPALLDLASSADYTARVLAGQLPMPPSIAQQAALILEELAP